MKDYTPYKRFLALAAVRQVTMCPQRQHSVLLRIVAIVLGSALFVFLVAFTIGKIGGLW